MTILIPQNDAVDMAFDDARAPREGEAGGDGVEVEAEVMREGGDGGRCVAFCLAYPLQQLVSAPVLEQVVEGADEVAGPGDVGAGQPHLQELVFLVRPQSAAGQHGSSAL
ncbi:hypothetical protein GCM10010339_86820 [Streptomyces alanosinicus]|uniref:Uncharacterized protein n=1 Tax=Streptomyces alanosinicus TaxID=68171 RepID=A0A919D7T1_9ACTN|nr:hypothetical protein GCM10010339_86820 [Streptomyces alanosinicus]